MKTIRPFWLLILALAGCEPQQPAVAPGEDASARYPVPQTPQQSAVQPVVNLGVGIGAHGTHTYGGVGFHQGPFSFYLGF